MRRVMVIDDHEPSRRHLVQTLTNNSYEIAGEGSSGRAALTLARSLAPEVIVMAVGLADINGIDAACDLMRAYPLPIVLITSHYDAATIESVRKELETCPGIGHGRDSSLSKGPEMMSR